MYWPGTTFATRAEAEDGLIRYIETCHQPKVPSCCWLPAQKALAVPRRLREIDTRIHALLDTLPDAALITSLPGMGAVLTAELLATTGGPGAVRQR